MDQNFDVLGTIEIHLETEEPHEAFDDNAMNTKPELSTKGLKWSKTAPVYKMAPPQDIAEAKLRALVDKYVALEPIQIYELFYDDEVQDFLVEQAHLYGIEKNHSFQLSKTDLGAFIGVLVLSGYHSLPQTEMYFTRDEDICVPLISKSISRARFREIKQNLHLCDNNNLDKANKFAKVRPFLDMLNRKYLQFGIYHRELSIDEQMKPYRGRHSCKMFMHRKPIKFGFKDWLLCSSTGYTYYVEPYQGKNTGKNDN